MRVHLQGGFGEKGRTSVMVEDAQTCIMLDAGIMVGAANDDYHPKLARTVTKIDAVIISHAHEDHIGALCWLVKKGYRGPIYMTSETHGEMAGILALYARPEDLAAAPPAHMDVCVFAPGDILTVGGLQILTGHSGHVAGGVWMRVSDRDNAQSMIFSGDVVPNSSVFPMSPFPTCDLLLADCSYGVDTVSVPERKSQILTWINSHPNGCLLPTPLSGRSLELIALMPGQFAIEQTMRESLMVQYSTVGIVRNNGVGKLRVRLEKALDWAVADEFPAVPLLVHDGMGSAGPSAHAIPKAGAQGFPMLFTGHLPDGSPGAAQLQKGRGDWMRLPTHPTIYENQEMWKMAGSPSMLGHSCSSEVLPQLKGHLPELDETARTGQTFDVLERGTLAHSNFQ